MKQIPKEIADRLIYEKPTTHSDPFHPRVAKILPYNPRCECGFDLKEVRVVRIARNTEPVPHYRENCGVCKKVSILDANDWKTAMELNREMRSADFQKAK